LLRADDWVGPINANWDQPFYGRGNAYLAKRDYNRAIADFNRSISLDPSNGWSYAGRGSAYYGNGNYDQAIADYNEASRLDPGYAVAFWGRGNAYKAKGERGRARANYDEAIRLELNPTITFAFPSEVDLLDSRRGARFAAPPLPNDAQLSQCISQNRNRGREDFYQCVIGQAFPEQYKVSRNCLNQNPQDGGRALLCTTQRQDLMQAYDRFRSVQRCATRSQDNWEVAECIGQQVLGQEEQYYLGCVTANKGDLKTAAVCAVARNLTPEQQIALSCAIATGGQPHAFAVCAGGQLLERELEKCWTHGLHTEGGCFGPNNEYVKFINNLDDEAQRVMGPNSEAYRAWRLWKENVLAPGPNGEVVKFLNNGIGDIREGPGENNEFVKLGNAAGDAIQGVGNIFDMSF
jgi:tetratricopeptide (TPR) repeat protein